MNEDTKAIVEAIRYVGDMVITVGVIITLQVLLLWAFSIKEAKRNRKVKHNEHNDDRRNRQA